MVCLVLLEAVVQRCSVKKVFLEISQNSQESTWARVSFLKKITSLRPATLSKKRLWHRCFPVNFVKFLRIPFYIEHLLWLLLSCISKNCLTWKISEAYYNKTRQPSLNIEVDSDVFNLYRNGVT